MEPFNFFKLPPELRNHVHEILVPRCVPAQTTQRGRRLLLVNSALQRSKPFWRDNPRLAYLKEALQSSAQLRQELLEVAYAQVGMRLIVHHTHTLVLLARPSESPENNNLFPDGTTIIDLDRIRKLEIDVGIQSSGDRTFKFGKFGTFLFGFKNLQTLKMSMGLWNHALHHSYAVFARSSAGKLEPKVDLMWQLMLRGCSPERVQLRITVMTRRRLLHELETARFAVDWTMRYPFTFDAADLKVVVEGRQMPPFHED